MKKNSLLLASLAIFSLSAFAEVSFSPPDATGADFSNTTPEVTVYVSPEGNDQADGTEGNPVKSLAAAGTLVKTNLEAGRGTEMRLTAGTWRENLPDFGPGDSALFIEGDPEGGTIISGSDILDEWESEDINGQRGYRADWPYNLYRFRSWNERGPNYEEQALANYRQVLFIDGELQKQVLDPKELSPGHYYVDEGDLWQPDGHILVVPPADADFENALKEVAVRGDSTVIQPEKVARFNDYVPGWPPQYMAHFAQRENIVLRNLTFQHGSSRLMFGAINLNHCKNVLVENVTIHWMNGAAFTPTRIENLTVRHSDISHNGGPGVQSHHVKNSLWEGNRFERNNWRSFWGKYAAWAVAGVKIHYYDNAIFRDNSFSDNYSDGFWIDLQNKRLLVENNRIERNLRFGLFDEVNWGGSIYRSNLISRNGGGHIIKGSQGSLIEGNTYVHNPIAIFNENRLFQGDDNIQPLRVWDNVPKDFVIRNNTFIVGLRKAEDYPRNIESSVPEWFVRRLQQGSHMSNVLSMVHPRAEQHEFLRTLTWENNTVEAPEGATDLYSIASRGGMHDEATFLAELEALQSGELKVPEVKAAFILSQADPVLLWDFSDSNLIEGWRRMSRSIEIKTDETGNPYLYLEQGFIQTEVRIESEVTRIKLSLRIKASGLDPADTRAFVKPLMRVYFRAADGARLGSPYNFLPLMQDADWTRIEQEFDVPVGTVSMNVHVGKGDSPAQVGFDDVRIEATGFVAMEQMED
jgi:hypothetical protein